MERRKLGECIYIRSGRGLYGKEVQRAEVPKVGVENLNCPNCKGSDLVFSGIQKGYGSVQDMHLWTCRKCLGTFSAKSLNCSNCKSSGLIFSGIQKGYGLVVDMYLWMCRRCGETFSVRCPDTEKRINDNEVL